MRTTLESEQVTTVGWFWRGWQISATPDHGLYLIRVYAPGSTIAHPAGTAPTPTMAEMQGRAMVEHKSRLLRNTLGLTDEARRETLSMLIESRRQTLPLLLAAGGCV